MTAGLLAERTGAPGRTVYDWRRRDARAMVGAKRPGRVMAKDAAETGKRRLLGPGSDAPAPEDVARWAGLTRRDGSPIGGTKAPPRRVLEGLAGLDAVARMGAWRDLDVLERKMLDPLLRLAFGLDRREPAERLRAAVVRSYWSAHRFAAALASDSAELQGLAAVNDLLAVFLPKLRGEGARRADGSPDDDEASLLFRAPGPAAWMDFGPIAVALKALRRRRGADQDDDARDEAIAEGLRLLSELHDEIGDALARWKRPGRPTDFPKLFLVARLAEVFAVLSGEPPAFHAGQLVLGGAPSRWIEYMSHALGAVGIKLSGSQIDESLRKLGHDLGARHFLDELSGRPPMDTLWSAGDRWYVLRTHLPSVGLMAAALSDDSRHPPPF